MAIAGMGGLGRRYGNTETGTDPLATIRTAVEPAPSGVARAAAASGGSAPVDATATDPNADPFPGGAGGENVDPDGPGGIPGSRAVATAQRNKRALEQSHSLFESWLNQLFGGSLAAGAGEDGANVGRGMPIGGMDGTGTMEALITRVGNLNSAEVSYLQRRLYQGGFYAASVYTNSASISWGMFDQASIQALEQALTMAGANQVTNFDRFLEEQRYRFAKEGTTADSRDVAGEMSLTEQAKVIDITLTDPDSIRLMAESSAATLLGRKPTEKELSEITAAIHQRERENQRRSGQSGLSNAGIETSLTGDDQLQLLRGDHDYVLPEVDGSGGPSLTAEQAENVSIIVQVANDMGLGDEYIVAAISAAMVESNLTNTTKGLPNKKGDYSIGLFQQHGHYGTKAQRLDPRWATQKFFEEALRYDGETIGEWVANTQRPAKQFRGRYAEVMNDAVQIFARATGRTGTSGGQRAGRTSSTTTSIRQAERGNVTTRATDTARGEHTQWDRLGRVGAVLDNELIEHEDQPPPGAFWIDAMLGSSGGDPIFREGYSVNQSDMIEMALRRSDPKAYETKQAASRAIEFFTLLGPGGGYTA